MSILDMIAASKQRRYGSIGAVGHALLKAASKAA
jgi:hypothetical protein